MMGCPLPNCLYGIIVPAGLMWCGVSAQTFQKESAMNRTAVAVALANNVYPLALADWRVIEQHRLTRTQFERFATKHRHRTAAERCR